METIHHYDGDVEISLPNNYGLKYSTMCGDEYISIIQDEKILVNMKRDDAQRIFEYALFILKRNTTEYIK